MNLKVCLLICISFTVIAEVSSAKPAKGTTSTTKRPTKDDIYIDEETEGSGAGASNADGKYDLEPGSGFGPDDEDADNDSATFSAPKKVDNANIKQTNSKEEFPVLPSPTTKSQPPLTSLAPETEPFPTDKFPKSFDKDFSDKKPSGIDDYTSTVTNIIERIPIDDGARNNGNGVYINHHGKDRTSSFFSQPGILAAVIGGAVVGLLCAILVVMFIVYRMKKKNEGSYVLEEMKRSPPTNPYLKPGHREFYA